MQICNFLIKKYNHICEVDFIIYRMNNSCKVFIFVFSMLQTQRNYASSEFRRNIEFRLSRCCYHNIYNTVSKKQYLKKFFCWFKPFLHRNTNSVYF